MASRGLAIAALLVAPLGAFAADVAWPPVAGQRLMVVVDPSFSMEPGVRTADSLGPLLFAYDAQLSARVAFDESTGARRALGVLGRLTKAALVDVPLVQFEDTAVHEIFGHGARAREFGQRPVYDFRLPAPYRYLAGASSYSGLTYLIRTGRLDLDLPVTEAGIEANYLSAWWLEARALRSGGKLHYSELIHYLNEKASYANRFAADLSRAGAEASSDPDEYIDELQRRFNRYGDESRAQTARALQRAWLWDLADPTLWLSAYHLVVDYAWRGERVSTLPRFQRGETWLYPGTRFNLSPFGAEHYLDLFAGRGERMLVAYLRVGSSGLASYTGAGVHLFGVEVAPGVTVGAEAHLWRQPLLLYEYRNAFDGPTTFGAAGALHADWRFYGPLGAVAKVALKSRGYLMGQPIAGGPYGYLGLSLDLDRPR